MWHVVSKRRSRGGCRGGDSALIWLDLAKIPNRGWSAVLVVSERLTLSLYHGNNLLLKPRKQINYGKDISRCHYGVIRRNISMQRAGQWCWQKGAVCVSVCVCACLCDHVFIFKSVSLCFKRTEGAWTFVSSYLCEFLHFTWNRFGCLQMLSLCAFLSLRFHVSVCLCVCVCARFSVLLWDCRTTSRLLNNESKHVRGAKSHCSSLSLCTAFYFSWVRQLEPERSSL